jgi:hypothetical protein
MKIKALLLSILVFCLTDTQAQSVKCTDLLQFIKQNGYRKGEVGSYQLMNSSWLKSVTAYTYDNAIFVVAVIKKNEYDFQGKTYIFCGIPSRNWDYFSIYDTNPSYGEKFRKYIIDYKCDCN